MKRIWILKMMGKSGPPDEAARSFSMTAMPSVCGESPHGRRGGVYRPNSFFAFNTNQANMTLKECIGQHINMVKGILV